MGMLRNDYRRALIMLRAVEKGCSGHARLERRTLMGTLGFVAATPNSSRRLFAALVGRRAGNYYAANLGELRRDSRGQYGLNASFDPRNIEGREIENYQLAVVVAVAEDGCSLILSGNVEGSEEMDWERVRAATCALFGAEANTQENAQEDAQENAQEAVPVGDFGGSYEMPEAFDEDLADYVAGSDEEYAQEEPHVDLELADFAAGSDEEPVDFVAEPDEGLADFVAGSDQEDGGLAEELESQLEGEPSDFVFPEAQQEAEEEMVEEQAEEAPICTLDIDLSIPWPLEIEPLRPFFQQNEAIAGPEIEGFTFVRVEMPEDSGFPFVAVGIYVEGNAPSRVCYGLPGIYAAEPPAGLTDYEWLGGSGPGWWIRLLDVEAP